jgi:hypothetical protein
MPDGHDDGDFREYRRLILAQLRTLEYRASTSEDAITKIKVAQATLMVKVGLLGAGTGLVAGAIVAKVMGAVG